MFTIKLYVHLFSHGYEKHFSYIGSDLLARLVYFLKSP
jgi:hypothetical protein